VTKDDESQIDDVERQAAKAVSGANHHKKRDVDDTPYCSRKKISKCGTKIQ
jgi:hypothetical protein